MTVSGQSPVTYAYDAASRLRNITQAPLNPVDIQYDAAGRRTLLTLPNGASTEYVYDLGSRLTGLVYRNALGLLGDLTYQYDPSGNRTGVGGPFARTLLPDPVPSATYDAANRQLTFGASTMFFDDNGNLGSLTTIAGLTTYTWDTRNRLTGIGGATLAANFAYDGLSRRAAKTINGQSTSFLYDGMNLAMESGPAGAALYLRSLATDKTLIRSDASGTFAYLADALGSTVTLADPSGNLVTTYTYAPFGETSANGSPSANPFQFTGRENDGTGLYYFRARYYDPLASRFITQERLDSSINDFDPTLYAYVVNGPVNFTDRLGLAKDRRRLPGQQSGSGPLKRDDPIVERGKEIAAEKGPKKGAEHIKNVLKQGVDEFGKPLSKPRKEHLKAAAKVLGGLAKEVIKKGGVAIAIILEAADPAVAEAPEGPEEISRSKSQDQD